MAWWLYPLWWYFAALDSVGLLRTLPESVIKGSLYVIAALVLFALYHVLKPVGRFVIRMIDRALSL